MTKLQFFYISELLKSFLSKNCFSASIFIGQNSSLLFQADRFSRSQDFLMDHDYIIVIFMAQVILKTFCPIPPPWVGPNDENSFGNNTWPIFFGKIRQKTPSIIRFPNTEKFQFRENYPGTVVQTFELCSKDCMANLLPFTKFNQNLSNSNSFVLYSD